MKQNAMTPKLVLNKETLRKLNEAAPVQGDAKGFIFPTKFSCYTPISCPVPCA